MDAYPTQARRRQRNQEHAELKAHLRRAGKQKPSAAEVAAAGEVRALRQRLMNAVGDVGSCSECARGCKLPEGTFAGGRCCSTPAENVFRPDEIDLLALGGCKPGDLARPKRDYLAGCLFRDNDGCSLSPGHRPTICIHYICTDLMQELGARGTAVEAAGIQDELGVAMRRYIQARHQRRGDEEFAEAFGELAVSFAAPP